MTNQPLEAHYTNASKTERALLGGKCRGTLRFAITQDGRRSFNFPVVYVTGKADARRMSAEHNARPWNF